MDKCELHPPVTKTNDFLMTNSSTFILEFFMMPRESFLIMRMRIRNFMMQ